MSEAAASDNPHTPRETPLPDERTVEAAVSVLQFELSALHGAVDALDRKAALVPPFLVAAAGFLLGPVGTAYTSVEVPFIALAVATGVSSSWLAYRALHPDTMATGPRASILQQYTWVDTATFRQRVVESLSASIQATTKTTLLKSQRLDRSLRLAGITLALLVLARVSGGLPVTDQSNQNVAPSPAASPQPASAAPASDPSSPTATPAPTPQPATPAPAAANVPSFGQQEAVRNLSLVPSFEIQIAAKGSTTLSNEERAIIEKGG